MHVLCAEDATVSDSLKLAIKYCDRIYFELDMDNMAELMGAMKYLRMNDGKKLSELLTKEEYAKVETYFKNNAVPLAIDHDEPVQTIFYFEPDWRANDELLAKEWDGRIDHAGKQTISKRNKGVGNNRIPGFYF